MMSCFTPQPHTHVSKSYADDKSRQRICGSIRQMKHLARVVLLKKGSQETQ